MKKKEFDPLEYIEQGFLDNRPKSGQPPRTVDTDLDVDVPRITEYLRSEHKNGASTAVLEPPKKYRKTAMRAPRPRKASKPALKQNVHPRLKSLWESIPRNIEFLSGFFDDSVTANYYGGDFKESREELILRLLDPELSLEESSRLLGVCPATVRRYTNRGWLSHHRTKGGQRRFRLSDIIRFVEEHGRFPEE
ncbi:MAG: helix-turn-helix domain-containing protein [Fimbriimonadaceae bacterium]|nr:helix-turn-helix domain-containing protein [Fimbriimonadaceae bacterium]